SPFFGRLHRLTVDNSSARLPIEAMGFPHIPAQSVVSRFTCPQQPPTSKVVVDRLIRREVLRQQAPLATATQDVEDSIHHLANVGAGMSGARKAHWVSIKSVG